MVLSGLTSNKSQTNYEKYILSNKEYWLSHPLEIEKDCFLYDENFNKIKTLSKSSSVILKDFSLFLNKHSYHVFCSSENDAGYVRLCNIHKPSGKSLSLYERQEYCFINAINEAISKYGKPIEIKTLNCNISSVYGIEKCKTTNSYGKSSYVDLHINCGDKIIGISNKSHHSPSIFGGGLTSLIDIDKIYIQHIFNKALVESLKSDHFELNSIKAKDIYISITNKDFLYKAISGNKAMGGPIDYFYIGDMNISYNLNKNEIIIKNGNLITVNDFIKENKFFLRIRRRNHSQIFTDSIDPRYNIPYIFRNIEGNERSRLVGTITVPKNAFIIED